MIKKFICSRCKSVKISRRGYCSKCMNLISKQESQKERQWLKKFRDNPDLEKQATEKYKKIPWNRDALLKAWPVVMDVINCGGKCNRNRIA